MPLSMTSDEFSGAGASQQSNGEGAPGTFSMTVVQESASSARPAADELEGRLEGHRSELTAYCYRMLASPFEAEDAVQETFIRAWRNYDRFEGRAALRSWLYRIATNVCLDMLNGRERRARPDGPRARGGARHRQSQRAARDDLDPADPGQPRRGGRPGGHRRRTRHDPPRIRRRPAAPAGAAAGGADPVRGAALEGLRGRRAARHERRLREQRAAACARDAGGGQDQRVGSGAAARRRRPRTARALRRGLRALRHRRAHVVDP